MDSEIEALIQSYAKDLPARAAEVTEALASVAKSLEEGGVARWDELIKRAHKLAGSSGTYGFPQLSLVCSYLEERLGEPSFKGLPRAAAGAHLKRWGEVFAEQWRLAAARKAPFETPDQLVASLRRHLDSVSQGGGGGRAA